MSQDYHLTSAGLKSLKAERAELMSRSAKVVELINAARQQGDLSENSEYQSAKSDQESINNRLQKIETILKNVVIIDQASSRDEVGLGATVKLENLDSGQVNNYTLVGTLEADPLAAKISDESPLGRALIGQTVNQEIKVVGPEHTTRYKILAIT